MHMRQKTVGAIWISRPHNYSTDIRCNIHFVIKYAWGRGKGSASFACGDLALGTEMGGNTNLHWLESRIESWSCPHLGSWSWHYYRVLSLL